MYLFPNLANLGKPAILNHMRLITLLCLFFCFAASAGIPTEGMTLDQAFDLTLKRTETAGIQNDLVEQAEERFVQSRGAILPTITGLGSYLKQEQPSSVTGNSISPSSQTTARINGTQPLFRGFREFAALSQTKSLTEYQKIQRDQALLAMYNDVVTSFYQVLGFERDISNYSAAVQTNRQRQEELRNLTRVGRSRPSELTTIEATIASLNAQIEATRGQLASARANFAYLTGVEADTPLDGGDLTTKTPSLEPIDSYLLTIRSRPDLRSLEKNQEAVEENIKIAWGAHLPSIDLTGNYWLDRPGVVSTVKWDFGVTVSLPIFNGGVIQSQVRQAHALVNQNELALQQARRKAKQEIIGYRALVEGDLAQLKQLEQAVELSRKSYESELHDYRLGLVTNVEVLQVLSSAQETSRLRDRARLSVRSDLLHLESAAGRRQIVAPGQKN